MNAAADGSCSPPLERVDKLRSSLRACVPKYVRFSLLPARKAAIADSCRWPIQKLISENKTPKSRGVGGF